MTYHNHENNAKAWVDLLESTGAQFAGPVAWHGSGMLNWGSKLTDWNLAEIWYATSEDGFVWKEQGVAVPRPPKPAPGWRSVSTPDVLFWKGKYYLCFRSRGVLPHW